MVLWARRVTFGVEVLVVGTAIGLANKEATAGSTGVHVVPGAGEEGRATLAVPSEHKVLRRDGRQGGRAQGRVNHDRAQVTLVARVRVGVLAGELLGAHEGVLVLLCVCGVVANEDLGRDALLCPLRESKGGCSRS